MNIPYHKPMFFKESDRPKPFRFGYSPTMVELPEIPKSIDLAISDVSNRGVNPFPNKPRSVSVITEPAKPSSVTCGLLPESPSSVEVARSVSGKPLSITVESTPVKPSQVTSITDPKKPLSVEAEMMPYAPTSVSVSVNPKKPLSISVDYIPYKPASVSIGVVPNKISSVSAGVVPEPVTSVTLLSAPAKPSVVDAFIPFVVTIMESEAEIIARASTTPSGTLAFGTDTKNLYVFNSAGIDSWGSFNEDTTLYTDAIPDNVLQTEDGNFLIDEFSNNLELEE